MSANDTLTTAELIPQSIIFKSDTLIHKVENVSQGGETFFTTDNPIWYVITLVISGLVTYFITSRQKRNDTITESKKLFLERRIEKHNALYAIVGELRKVTGDTQQRKSYHLIFKSYDSMTKWYDGLFQFAAENHPFLSSNVLEEIAMQNFLRQLIDNTYQLRSMNDEELQAFAAKYYYDLLSIFNRLREAIALFYEKEISLNYKFTRITNQQHEKIKNDLFKYSIAKDNVQEAGLR